VPPRPRLRPAPGNALLFSWLVTGVVVFGFSSQKFPQYFVSILVPAYCYRWTELVRWDWRPGWKNAAIAVATLAGAGSFLLAIPVYSVKAGLAGNPAHPAKALSVFEGRKGAQAISECARIFH
jgi:4-amino-4-deoxy-L-arabinose transferase-like glycosyltransferase